MDKFIVELPNFIPDEICNKIIELFEKSQNKEIGVINYDFDTKTKRAHKRLKNNLELTLDKISIYLDKLIFQYVNKAINIYNNNIAKENDFLEEYHPLDRLLSYKTISDTSYCVQKISKGNMYQWHSDFLPGDNFYIQMIIYLNTMTDEDGGHTELINGRKIIPECGKVLIFPCTWNMIHRGCKVENGSKYIITTTIQTTY